MKPSEIYLEAAKLIDSRKSKYSCFAIKGVLKWPMTYLSLPIARDYGKFWGYSSAKLTHTIEHNTTEAKARELRVWLLCMAAAIVEEEEAQ